MIRVAACQYHIDLLSTWDAYAEHLTALCEEAAGQGAELLLLPEYAGLVLTGQLPEDQREAIILIGASGFSYEEAAEICGCAVGTIKSRVNRARNRLTELLDDEHRSGGAQGVAASGGRLVKDTARG